MPKFSFLILLSFIFIGCQTHHTDTKSAIMMFGDTTRIGKPYSKDPHVVKLHDEYFMYYSIPSYADTANPVKGWGIGIAKSKDLINWERAGEVIPAFEYEKNGVAAPGALVRNDTVHLFYQTYGNRRKDAICHAYSTDGIHFTRNPTNPVFAPAGDWTVGRAIDAEVVNFKDTFYLYYATRDTAFQIQIQGVAIARGKSFDKGEWVQAGDGPILVPKYPWEGKCIEGASVIQVGDILYMFYAGAYNNDPQQIGVAKSTDGVHWERLSNKPILPNGDPGEWNYSESGHPHIFRDTDGKTWLFFQGNNDMGKTWYISKVEVKWNEKGPYIGE